MWIFLKEEGFFSIAQNDRCKLKEVVVRARCRSDLDKLQTRILADFEFDAKIIDTPDGYYACRFFAPKKIILKYLTQAVMNIDYGNFKSTISSKDKLRHDAYYGCWESLWQWQEKLNRRDREGG